jgi:hypothetical protein
MLMVKVAVSPPAPTILALPVCVLGARSLTLGRRKLIPSLEHVTFSVPTPTPNNSSDPLASLAARKETFDLLDSLWRNYYVGAELSLQAAMPPHSSFEFLVSYFFLGCPRAPLLRNLCLRNAEARVDVAYACRYPTGRKLLVDDVILRFRYVASVSTRRMQVKSV